MTTLPSDVRFLLDGDQALHVCAEGLSVYDLLKKMGIIGKELEYQD
jgi:hypothetical protein